MIEYIGDLELTDEYWDCECEKDFIHSRVDDFCIFCKVEREDQPDSRVSEVLDCGLIISQIS